MTEGDTPGGTSTDPTAGNEREPGWNPGGVLARMNGNGGAAGGDWLADESLTLDQSFDILKNRRRRRVLVVLDSVDGQISVRDLAERIAAWENDKELGGINYRERKRVHTGLYQHHLPKMDDLDIISYNRPRGTLEEGPNAAVLKRFLRAVDDPPASRASGYELLLHALVVVLPVLALLVQSLAASSPLVSVVTVLLISLAISVGVYLVYRRRNEPVSGEILSSPLDA